MSQRILIVEDNNDMREVLTRFLENNGFAVSSCDSTEDAIDEIDEHDFDLILIDINLPGKSGFSLIEYVREQNKTMPLIAMTARDGLQDKLNGFELGLTDYLVKPFELKELLARMQVHLSHTGTTNHSAAIQTQHYRINPESWEFFIDDRPRELTRTEFRIMHILMLHHRTVVKLNDLIEFVWGDTPEALNPPVRIHLANLRKKIGDDTLSIIKTIPGIGYRLSDGL